MSDYVYSNNWFDTHKGIWDQLLPMYNPSKMLEVGSYEGASACYLVEKLAPSHPIELHCVDTWEGGIEHQAGGMAASDMNSVEQRFQHNIRLAVERSPNPVDLHIHKGYSDHHLASLLAKGMRNHFDLIYIDGSHQAPDVLCDAVLAFRLLRVGGLMVFDDYTWSETAITAKDPIRCPKVAIDTFTNIYCRKLAFIKAPLLQLYVQKMAD